MKPEESSAPSEKKSVLKPLLVVVIVLIVVAAVVLILAKTDLVRLFSDREAFQAFVDGFGFWGPLVFVLLQIVQVIISFIPGNVTTMAGAAMFGLVRGFFLSYVGIVGGSLIAFAIARRWGSKVVRKMVGATAFDKYFEYIHAEGTVARTRVTLIVMMLLPLFPDDLICLLAGLTALRFSSFVLIMVITRPWGLIFSALLGAGTLRLSWWALGAILVFSFVLGGLSVRYAPQIERFVMGKLARWQRK